MSSNELGKFLESLRGKMSLRAAADKSGISHNYIRELEQNYSRNKKGEVTPSPDVLKKLALAYEYSYEELMKLAGHMPQESLPVVSESSPLINIKNKKGGFETIDLRLIYYIELEENEIIHHLSDREIIQVNIAYNELSEFLEILEQHGFKKMNRTIYVNFNLISKFDHENGKLFFNIEGVGKFVLISSIKANQHQRILRLAIANNTNTTSEFQITKPSSIFNKIIPTTKF